MRSNLAKLIIVLSYNVCEVKMDLKELEYNDFLA
jgi:hypothetical protein